MNVKRAVRAGACRLLVAVPLAVLAVGAPAPAVAVDLNALWPDLGLPGFKITPFLGQRFEYESNVFQAHSGSQDDVISKTIPGFVLELPLGRHKIASAFGRKFSDIST